MIVAVATNAVAIRSRIGMDMSTSPSCWKRAARRRSDCARYSAPTTSVRPSTIRTSGPTSVVRPAMVKAPAARATIPTTTVAPCTGSRIQARAALAPSITSPRRPAMRHRASLAAG